MAPPVATAGHGDARLPGVDTRTDPAAVCELVPSELVTVVVVELEDVTDVDVAGADADVDVDSMGCDLVPTAVVVSLEAGGTVSATEVDVEGGAHVEAGSGDPFGGGSLGFPAPAAWNRQPSTMFECTRDPPGPTFE